MTSSMHETRSRRGTLRARLALADRMTSLGMIAAGAAHELATPLVAVVANLDHLQRTLEQAVGIDGLEHSGVRGMLDEALSAVADARTGAELAATIVRDLKAFSRPAAEQRAPVDIRTPVERALRLVGPDLRQRARVTSDLGHARTVLGSESLLTQVFVDLLVNAGQAMVEPPTPESVIAVRVTGGHDEAIVAVTDSGIGIPEAHLPRIFEPFFTTKPRDVGTGLGLWICRQIVSAHGGRITVESAPGRGARFEVCLPAECRASPTELAPLSGAEPSPPQP